jgi:hypothetical protein
MEREKGFSAEAQQQTRFVIPSFPAREGGLGQTFLLL